MRSFRPMLRLFTVGFALACSTAMAAEAPHLEKRGMAVQLIVDGEPFLIRGGELGNSTASSREDMASIWPKLAAMNLNTVLAPVTWEAIEPVEGRYDFTLLDELIGDARAHRMRLVLLWFGTWKNSTSSYAPSWVKRDPVRFARTIGKDGRAQEIISTFSVAARDADAHAFAAMMRHLRGIDGSTGTVLMVQVENEVGFLPFARETGATADAAFTAPVPLALAPGDKSWRATYGGAAEETFTAWFNARYVQAVAAAGKREYPLPMFVNGAQSRPGVAPGDYPSGGPLAHLAGVWRAGAPSVDFIAPDIYFPNFSSIVADYSDAGVAPIFVPEADRPGNASIVPDILGAIGRHAAIGASPFAIEGANPAQAARIASLYGMLCKLAPKILAAQSQGRLTAFGAPVGFSGEADLGEQVRVLGPVRFTATMVDPWSAPAAQDSEAHGALLIWLGGEDYLFAGQGVTVTMEPADDTGRIGIERVREVRIREGLWGEGRALNGDETHQGRHLRLPPGENVIQRVRVYRY